MITRISFFVCFLFVALVNAKSNRIIGGYKATSGQFKYQVSVQVDHDHCCGGAIITDQHVLTAAHCVVDPDDGKFFQMNYQIVAAATNLLDHKGVRIDVEKIYVPTKYLFMDMSNDIAVLKLRRSLGLDSKSYLQSINLPSCRESSYVDQTAVIAGFGLTHVELRTDPKTGQLDECNGRRNGKLKYVIVKIISNPECLRQYPIAKIGENQFCGQTVQREGDSEGICTGDSGGPLVIGNTIIGIASQSPLGCNEQLYPAAYTRVSAFIGFIKKAIKDTKSTHITEREIYS